jgi:hypothetical protein
MGLVSRGTGNDGPVSTATASSFPERGWRDGRVTISEQIETARRERRVLARVCRAGWRLEQAGRERAWALASALAGGAPIRALAGAWLVRTARFAAMNMHAKFRK